jgi:quercetin dioxygenase-like cupin family protein
MWCALCHPFTHTIPPMQSWELDRKRIPARQPEVLHDEGEGIRLIAVRLPQGESLQEHHPHEHTIVFLTRGLVRLRTGPNERMLSSPSLIHFTPGEQHDISALNECHLVLSLTPSASAP